MDNSENVLLHKRHANYFKRFLHLLPSKLSSHDSTRFTIAFFAICGLDVLDSLKLLDDSMVKDIINWIYYHQVIPDSGQKDCGGFQGSSVVMISQEKLPQHMMYKWGHLAMTYTGIASLVSLGDDLSGLDRDAILKGVRAVQKPDGSFSASVEGSENDMRFVYCAAAICAMLDDWSYINKQKMAEYIYNSIRYDYGVSQEYEMESHGGTTFCAIAALNLSNQLDVLDDDTKEGIKRWLLFRQVDGFNGRPNKPVDTCYSFWIAATLKILDCFELSDYNENRNYILSTQNQMGGFSKWPSFITDPFHTYFGICGLSFLGEEGLLEVNPSLNISARAYTRLKQIQKEWKSNQKNHVAVDID